MMMMMVMMMMMMIGDDKDNNDDDGDDKARYLLPPRAARGWWQITEEYGHHRNFRLLTCFPSVLFKTASLSNDMLCIILATQSLPAAQLFLALADRVG